MFVFIKGLHVICLLFVKEQAVDANVEMIQHSCLIILDPNYGLQRGQDSVDHS